MTITGILLAAGRSTRFGTDKLLHPLDGETPVGVAAARTLRDAVDRTLAIVRPGQPRLCALLEGEGLRVITCRSPEPGMGASIAQAVAASAGSAGWLIALADMPYIQPSTACAVAALLRQGSSVVVPCHGGRRGHPVGFHQALGGELLSLRGDAGARCILDRHPELITRLDGDDPGILIDIDAPADIR